jgi:hypothetical protein
MLDYLRALAETGLYGKNPTEVARNLIEEGIRSAIQKNFILIRKAAKKTVGDPSR